MGRSLVTLLARCPQPHISFALLVLVLIFHSKASQRHCETKPFKADGVTAQVLPGLIEIRFIGKALQAGPNTRFALVGSKLN